MDFGRREGTGWSEETESVSKTARSRMTISFADGQLSLPGEKMDCALYRRM